MLGEALDAAAAWPVVVAQPRGDLALQVERQAILGAAGQIVDVAAHRGEEALGALSGRPPPWSARPWPPARRPRSRDKRYSAIQNSRCRSRSPPLPFLDVGLDDVAQIAHALMALVALGELGLDEVTAVAGQEFLGETLISSSNGSRSPTRSAPRAKAPCGSSGRARHSAGSSGAGGVADLQPMSHSR